MNDGLLQEISLVIITPNLCLAAEVFCILAVKGSMTPAPWLVGSGKRFGHVTYGVVHMYPQGLHLCHDPH